MALSYASAGTGADASGASPRVVATTVALAVGDVLMVAMAYDNSGGSGADPLTNFAVATAAGALSLASTQTGLNDPGAASAGVAARCNTYYVTQAIASSTNISLSWTGTVVVRAIALAQVTCAAGFSVGYRTDSGTGTNTVASATPALTTPSVTTAELVLCWVACEWGASLTGDADSTNGNWGSIITTSAGAASAAGIGVGIQGKTVTGTATQAFNPTNGGNSTDWILGAVIFQELAPPVIPTMPPPIPPIAARERFN